MYTVNIGQYRPERMDIKCYTEDKLGNAHYSSRLYKILSHVYDPVEWSVYVDADIFLPDGMEEKLIDEVKKSGKLVGVFPNPWRNSVREEGDEVVRLGKDSKENVESWFQFMESMKVPELYTLMACGVLVRHNLACRKLNEQWWSYVCAYSKRDQLSFPFTFNDDVHVFDGDIYQYKRWPKK